MRTVEQIRGSLNPKLQIQGVVLTMYDRRTSLSDRWRRRAAPLGEKVYETMIPRNVRVAEAPSHGKPVLLYDIELRRQPGLHAARLRGHRARAANACGVIA